MLHIHGQNILFDSVCNYPVQVFNWHDRETSINLTTGINHVNGIACGGLSRDETMLLGTPEAVAAEIRDGFEQTDGKKWIIGTGCVMMTTTPIVNIWAAIETSQQLLR
jgi:uroporphyrinogen decarboxylase